MRTFYFYIVVPILTDTAKGFDGSMMNCLQGLTYWQDYFGHPRGAILGFFNSSMSLGSLLALLSRRSLLTGGGGRSSLLSAVGLCS